MAVQIASAGPPQYVANLDATPTARLVPFDGWWNEPVFVDPSGMPLSRGDLILTAANQDGGAHVDPALDERYAKFAKDNAMGWSYPGPGGMTPIQGPERAALRKMAHEIVRTLRPGYRKDPVPKPGVTVAGASIEPVFADEPVRRGDKVGRNDRCPCGSGRKYKKFSARSRVIRIARYGSRDEVPRASAAFIARDTGARRFAVPLREALAVP